MGSAGGNASRGPGLRRRNGRPARWSAALGLRRAALALCLAAIPGVAPAQAVLRGRVLAEDGTPIAGASVMLAALRYAVRTDSTGAFLLTGTPGSSLALSVAADGFRADTATVTLVRGRPVVRDFTLRRADAPVPEEAGDTRYVRGVVTDLDGAPLAYANVQLNGGTRYLANDSGRFTIPVRTTGRLTVLARRIGFEAAEVGVDSIGEAVLVRLKALAVSLPGQVITARSPFASLDIHGFYGRMRDAERGATGGYFITPEDLELRKPLHVTNAVEHLPNIRIRPGNAEFTKFLPPGGADTVRRGVTAARNLRIEDRSGCPMSVFVDGIRVSPLLSRVRRVPEGSLGINDLQDEQVNTLISPVSVAGIEVYTREASTPAQFQPIAGTCGSVVIWSK